MSIIKPNKVINELNHYSYYICHRKPERTFKIKGHYLPVCARCTGFYLSAFTYCFVAMIYPFKYTNITTVLAIILLIPSFIDAMTQFFELIESNNYLRLVTGILGGLGLVILFKTLKFYLIY